MRYGAQNALFVVGRLDSVGGCGLRAFLPIGLAAAEPNNVRGPQTPQQPTAKPGMVRLNFPAEVELRTLADYVGGRLGIKIFYDEEVANKKVSLRVPGEVPVESLLGGWRAH